MEPDERESAYELFQRGSRMLAEHHFGASAVLLERALALEPGKASILEALGQANAVGVELSQVTYMDSSGIAALVEGFQTARSKGLKFALVSASSPVRSVLSLARLDKVFPMVDSAEAVKG